jgi:hypothetical protein
MVLLEIPSGTFLSWPGKEICGKGDMGGGRIGGGRWFLERIKPYLRMTTP